MFDEYHIIGVCVTYILKLQHQGLKTFLQRYDDITRNRRKSLLETQSIYAKTKNEKSSINNQNELLNVTQF